MRRRHVRVMWGALAALALVGVYRVTGFGDGAATTTRPVEVMDGRDFGESQVAENAGAHDAIAAAQAPSIDQARIALPLPPPDASLDAVIAELLPRAEAGEARASCRLGFELLRCETLQRQGGRMLGTLSRRERRADQEGDGYSANRVAQEQIALLSAQENCRGLPAELAGRGSEFLYAAAVSGHRESMLRFIQGDGLAHLPGTSSTMDAAAFIGHPHFETWYREAPRMAEAMIRRGDTAALFYMVIGHGGDSYDLFAARVQDDPVRYAAYLNVLTTLNGRPARSFAELTGVQLAQARQLSAEMLAGPFANARHDREFLNRIWHPGDSLTPDSVARCD